MKGNVKNSGDLEAGAEDVSLAQTYPDMHLTTSAVGYGYTIHPRTFS
jgi:hypothetical protein